MKTIIVSTTLALLAAVAQTAPIASQVNKARQFEVAITFIGVDSSDSYSLSFPADAEPVTINNPKSVSKISSAGGGICSFTGIDGSDTVVVGEQEVDVGPPQTQVRGVCDTL